MGGRLGSTSKNALKFMMEAEKVHKKLQKNMKHMDLSSKNWAGYDWDIIEYVG
jgi:hypothetical protein